MTTLSTTSGIDAVVFDLGGVFTDSSPFDAVARMAAEVGVDGDLGIRLVFGDYDDDTDHPWHRAERGELDIQTTRAEILAHSEAECGQALDLFDLLRFMGSSGLGFRESFVDRARRLRAAGVRTGLLTNNVVEFRSAWMEKLPMGELFDDIIDSSAVGFRKPDERVYRLSLERLGVADPTRAVFVDDWPGNVVAARRIGMRGVVVALDPTDALAEIDALFGW